MKAHNLGFPTKALGSNCQCEHSTCHGGSTCNNLASYKIHFDDVGTFLLCDDCITEYNKTIEIEF